VVFIQVSTARLLKLFGKVTIWTSLIWGRLVISSTCCKGSFILILLGELVVRGPEGQLLSGAWLFLGMVHHLQHAVSQICTVIMYAVREMFVYVCCFRGTSGHSVALCAWQVYLVRLW
jgi:hypothetical protein